MRVLQLPHPLGELLPERCCRCRAYAAQRARQQISLSPGICNWMGHGGDGIICIAIKHIFPRSGTPLCWFYYRPRRSAVKRVAWVLVLRRRLFVRVAVLFLSLSKACVRYERKREWNTTTPLWRIAQRQQTKSMRNKTFGFSRFVWTYVHSPQVNFFTRVLSFGITQEVSLRMWAYASKVFLEYILCI